MSSTSGGANNSGAKTIPVWAQKAMDDSAKWRLEHDKAVEGAFTAASKQIGDTQAAMTDGFKRTAGLIGDLSKQTADGFDKTRELIGQHDAKVDRKLNTIVHRTKTTTSDIVIAIVLGVGGFFTGWNIAAANTNLFFNKVAIGGLGFIIGFMIVVALSAFLRGRYEETERKEDAPAQPAQTPAPKPEEPKPADSKKDEKPADAPKPTGADKDQPAK